MRPRFEPRLVNGRTGDPALHVRLLDERRALLFDLGDLAALASRALLRLSDVFVSHAHMDHFIGFDRLLRVLLGRERRLRLWGPARFIEHVEARLRGYEWNLAARFREKVEFEVAALEAGGRLRRARFRLATGFAREELPPAAAPGGLLLAEPRLSVRAAVLDHHGLPCLAFAAAEPAHVNVWPDRLAALGLAPGPWLATLKAAVLAGAPDPTPITALRRGPAGGSLTLPLGALRGALSISAGQKIAYATDFGLTFANARRVIGLARGADVLFIEATFRAADTELARARGHLTTVDAGRLARLAGVRRVEPFHFSARYEGREAELIAEVAAAFAGGGPPAGAARDEPGSAGRAPERATERATGRTPERATERATERTPERASEQAAERGAAESGPSRGTGRTAGAPG